MGNRKFYDQLIADLCQHEKDKITDETDVTTLKDYMQVSILARHSCLVLRERPLKKGEVLPGSLSLKKGEVLHGSLSLQYLSHLDECPADIGGKSNTWRRLTLDGMIIII